MSAGSGAYPSGKRFPRLKEKVHVQQFWDAPTGCAFTCQVSLFTLPRFWVGSKSLARSFRIRVLGLETRQEIRRCEPSRRWWLVTSCWMSLHHSGTKVEVHTMQRNSTRIQGHDINIKSHIHLLIYAAHGIAYVNSLLFYLAAKKAKQRPLTSQAQVHVWTSHEIWNRYYIYHSQMGFQHDKSKHSMRQEIHSLLFKDHQWEISKLVAFLPHEHWRASHKRMNLSITHFWNHTM